MAFSSLSSHIGQVGNFAVRTGSPPDMASLPETLFVKLNGMLPAANVNKAPEPEVAKNFLLDCFFIFY
jgi:hypothetical protein